MADTILFPDMKMGTIKRGTIKVGTITQRGTAPTGYTPALKFNDARNSQYL